VLATTSSASLVGTDGLAVTVEAHVGPGLPGFTVVGLPDASCREVRDRARAATLCSGLTWPNQRTTVNLAPSGERKVGSSLDLAVAVVVLAASGQIPLDAVAGVSLIGELGLDGSVRPVPGVVAMVAAIDGGRVVVPTQSAVEASLPGGHRVVPVRSLAETVAVLRGRVSWPPEPTVPDDEVPPPVADLADIRGNPVARRALEVAAAGGHNLLMVGPPGSGKTMLAERLVGLLPPLDHDTALEVTRVHSAAGQRLPAGGLIRRPPLRAPHHGASGVAVIGGGSHHLRPGEISLANGGVLFLDELPEFAAGVLDALRTPLEEGVVRIARAHVRATMPARFLLVAAMNPCPCGAAGGPGQCRCTPVAIARYARRVSGPLLDRFDLRVTVPVPEPAALFDPLPGESSAVVAARVLAARAHARQRGVACNAQLDGASLEEVAPLDGAARDALHQALTERRLSARGLRRVRALALTLADLAGAPPPLGRLHVLEAMALRHTGFEQAGFEQTGFGQAGLEQGGFEQTGLEQAGLEKRGPGQRGAAQA
jgi:magnesium chelatase family protein